MHNKKTVQRGRELAADRKFCSIPELFVLKHLANGSLLVDLRGVTPLRNLLGQQSAREGPGQVLSKWVEISMKRYFRTEFFDGNAKLRHFDGRFVTPTPKVLYLEKNELLEQGVK